MIIPIMFYTMKEACWFMTASLNAITINKSFYVPAR